MSSRHRLGPQFPRFQSDRANVRSARASPIHWGATPLSGFGCTILSSSFQWWLQVWCPPPNQTQPQICRVFPLKLRSSKMTFDSQPLHYQVRHSVHSVTKWEHEREKYRTEPKFEPLHTAAGTTCSGWQWINHGDTGSSATEALCNTNPPPQSI